jgi:hypothetical protein
MRRTNLRLNRTIFEGMGSKKDRLPKLRPAIWVEDV